MGLNWNIKKHPARLELFAYAECLAAGGPVPAALAGHVAGCPACGQEVAAMRASLQVTASLPELEPPADLTSRILLEARTVRTSRKHRAANTFLTVSRGMAYATASLAVMVVVFGAALGNPASEAAPVATGAPVITASGEAGPSPESLRKAADTVNALSQAVRVAADAPQSREELEKLRTVDAMDADIVAARQALERNPGCVRASHIVHANLQRQAKTLRDLYVQRAF